MKWGRLRAGLSAALLMASPITAAASDGGVRRFALIIGANDGGPDRSPLRFAEADARTFATVIRDLGGVAPQDQILVLHPDKAELVVAIGELRQRIEAAEDVRTEVVVYYSGHSDERGLLLRTQRFSYKELRDAVQNFDSDVRIAILDSCASGALVTGKGGRHVAGFLENEANQVAGHAYLTSSAANEVSQEAASLGGSYFTHALVTGLRGAADTNTDGLVTLNEAYRFAFEETLTRTESSRFGAQHANFDIQLSGSGDLVMTDLRSRTATLHLAAPISGRVFIRDSEGRLVAELGKEAGREVTLLVEPGRYKVAVLQDEQTWVGLAVVDGTAPAWVAAEHLAPAARVATTARGDTSTAAQRAERLVEGLAFSVEESMFGLNIEAPELQGSALALAWTHIHGPVQGAQLAFALNAADQLDGIEIALGANLTQHRASGLQAAIGLNSAGTIDAGVQLSNGANIVLQDALGTQGTTGVNIVGGDLHGAQLAAGVNIVGHDIAGAQLAAGANIAGGAAHGVQLAAGMNVAHGLTGYQGAVVNIAGNGRGTQTGVVNIAGDFDGAMVGVVNIAHSTDAPVGLVNLVIDGIHDLEVSSNGGTLYGTVKLGGSHVYTSYSGSYTAARPGPLGDWQLGAAMGGRSKGDGILVTDVDVGVNWMSSHLFSAPADDARSLTILVPRAQLALGIPLLDGHVTPFASGNLNLGIAVEKDTTLPDAMVQWPIHARVGAWPSWLFGLRLSI